LPESSDGFFEPPLELFSLERKGRPLPDGLFVFLAASRQTALELGFCKDFSAPASSRSARKSASPAFFCWLRMSLRSKPLEGLASGLILQLLMQATRRTSRPRGEISLTGKKSYTADAMTATGTAKKRTMAPKARVALQKDFADVFSALRALLSPYARELAAQTDKPGYYCLESRTPTYKNRPMYFAGVRLGKNYVSYYLIPVYAGPEMLKAMSPGLKKRMQGKACFNFTAVDRELFAELSRLTKAGFDKFKSLKYL
jgi:hypothetical protein